MALKRTERCRGNFVISHVKTLKFRAKIKEYFATYDVMKLSEHLSTKASVRGVEFCIDYQFDKHVKDLQL